MILGDELAVENVTANVRAKLEGYRSMFMTKRSRPADLERTVDGARLIADARVAPGTVEVHSAGQVARIENLELEPAPWRPVWPLPRTVRLSTDVDTPAARRVYRWGR